MEQQLQPVLEAEVTDFWVSYCGNFGCEPTEVV